VDDRREPIRTCVACRQEAGKRSLTRLVRTAEGKVSLDARGRAPGRGAYLHADPTCVEQARRRRALQRSLRAEVPERVWQELDALSRAAADGGD
jgi:hypothetical protein